MTEPNPADEPIDSGMDGLSIMGAEAFWANLPTGRKWASLKTYEKALVCHQMDRLEATQRQQFAAEIERLRALLARARDRIDEMERNSGHDYELDWTPEQETLLGLIDAALSQESADA